ncbi:hypothetical protein [Hydrogenophaga sp. BPS33]|uniref:hypothetical protein n=1 Tax=Hydrogenophaga sp. BPS33 TaxID=2651974 RepID=UPI00131F6A64|nr:hypothetical protein [Hydrogenophaga sp. BPS33]QHE83379.1 hypothetical protein F9K07_00025 [Hydrogenophaga sp. BPS33]
MSQVVYPEGLCRPLVTELALRLHREDGIGLHIDVPDGAVLAAADMPDGCQLVEGAAVQFDSLEARNVIVASATFEGLHSTSGIDANELFERAYGLWCDEIGHNDQASGRLLALASVNIDVLAVAAQRIRDGSDVFDVLHLVEAALPHLQEVEASSIVDLFVAKYEPTKNDMASGAIHGALESWLETHVGAALELHAKVLENLSEATASLLGNAVAALAKTDYASAIEVARRDVRSGAPLRERVGVWALGRLLLDERAPSPLIDLVTREVVTLIEREQGELRLQAIHAAASAMHILAVFDSILERLAEGGDQDVLCAVATALFLRAKDFSERGSTPRWVGLMTSLKPEFKGAIRNLDHALAKLLSDPANAPMVASTLEKWVANHGHRAAIDSETASLFNHTVRKLVPLEASWESLVTNWLLSDQQAHPAALAGFLSQLSHHSRTELRLDKGRLNGLATEDLLFLARRLLGYVHDRAQLTSLALSMLLSNESERRIYPILGALLVDEIGYDYPGSTSAACRNATEAASMGSHKEFLLKVAETVDQVVNEQSSLPMLNELRPPTRLRRLFSRARAKQMNESFEEASRDSIWRQVSTQITIKAGRGTFSYQDANYGPSMKLSSMSHSIELPRREAFDPIGNSIRHLGFRLAKLDES